MRQREDVEELMARIPEGIMQEVRRLYAEQPQAQCFKEDLRAHLEHEQGHVFITESLLLMGRAVSQFGSHEQLGDPWFVFDETQCDAWYVWLAVGQMQEILAHAPHPLPWIGFARRRRMKWYEWEKLRRKGKGQEKTAKWNKVASRRFF